MRAASPEATTTAAAPSTMPEAFPAWMTPSSWKLGLSAASDSTVVPGRGCSSSAKRRVVPSASFTGTGAISCRNQPAARAAMALLCEAAANSSSCPRESDHLRAISSAERPWWVRSGKRSASRGEVGPSPKPASEPIGMRVIDSTPPPMPSWICPARMPCAMSATAVSPLPQSRFTVLPGTSMGIPAASTAPRATSKACSPIWVTQPSTTSSTRPAGTPVRSSAALEHVGRQVDRVNSGQAPLALPARSPDRIDDRAPRP